MSFKQECYSVEHSRNFTRQKLSVQGFLGLFQALVGVIGIRLPKSTIGPITTHAGYQGNSSDPSANSGASLP